MHKFGSSGIVTGYIKQLLATFELPMAHIYTREQARYYDEHLTEHPSVFESFLVKDPFRLADKSAKADANQVTTPCLVPYIKDGRFQLYVGGYYSKNDEFIPGHWQSSINDLDETRGGPWHTYERGSYFLNQTRKFQIKNNVYDAYTHEYLGEYLRFIRDYDGIDLLPLYNCFSNNICSARASVNVDFDEEDSSKGYFTLDPTDSNYKIYMVPVKFGKNYTIAIDSSYPVELCCGFYNTKIDLSKQNFEELMRRTYSRQPSMYFSKPILYTALTDILPQVLPEFPLSEDIKKHFSSRNLLASSLPNEKDLKLFIKVSKYVDSSIVVLEGNYLNWNDSVSSFQSTPNPKFPEDRTKNSPAEFKQSFNHTVISNEAIVAQSTMTLITPLQLLRFNTGTQVPFADKLLEYLLDACVTGGDEEVRENVLMAQYLAGLRHKGEVSTNGSAIPLPLKYNMLNGVWDESLRKIFYRYMSNKTNFSLVHDVLGYVDKDVEKNFSAKIRSADGKKVLKKTMLTFDAWEDIEQ